MEQFLIYRNFHVKDLKPIFRKTSLGKYQLICFFKFLKIFSTRIYIYVILYVKDLLKIKNAWIATIYNLHACSTIFKHSVNTSPNPVVLIILIVLIEFISYL